MMKVLDKFLLKIGLTKTGSPNLRGIAKDEAKIHQQSTQVGRNAYVAGHDS